uniref:SFRICE_011117 n=1 Tax=Spodoptera frugiperda TaxID=7108 RepID=A0A2H1W0I5_SPOFR
MEFRITGRLHFFTQAGKQADGSPDGKQSLPPMEPRNIRGVTCALSAFWGWLGKRGLGRGVTGPPVTSLTQRKRCFTSVFCETVVSLRSSRPIRAEACLSYTNISSGGFFCMELTVKRSDVSPDSKQ